MWDIRDTTQPLRTLSGARYGRPSAGRTGNIPRSIRWMTPDQITKRLENRNKASKRKVPKASKSALQKVK